MTEEEWRAVPEYEGLYEVSSAGNVRTLRQDRALKPRPVDGKAGHLKVTLSHAGVERQTYVHRLVLAAFVGPCPEGMEACHNNGDSQDNRLENLRWDTRGANNRDRVLHGGDHNARKTHCPAGHEYNEANTYRAPDGRRECRECRARRRPHWTGGTA